MGDILPKTIGFHSAAQPPSPPRKKRNQKDSMTKYFSKSKKTKQNCTRPENFDI